MVVHCQTIMSLLEEFAPKHLAEDGDNIGLQVGNPAQPVGTVFLCLDLNPETLEEALAVKADMVIVHHTPFFKSVKNIRTDLPGGRLISMLVQNNMALYAAHTNLDAVWGGVSDLLAQKLGLEDVTILSPVWRQKLYKLVVFIPAAHLEQVREAILKNGAGWIGNYSDCTFRVSGTGTFRPLEGTDPFIGQKGELESVAEIRLETIVPEKDAARVIKAMLKAHPYDEVAYDLYPLLNEGAKAAGLGRVGRLRQPQSFTRFIQQVKEKLEIPNLRYCGNPDREIEKVAVCGGSGMPLLSAAVFAGAQVYLTADIKYHEAQDAIAQGIALVDAGHYATERPIVDALAEFLRAELAQEKISILISQTRTDPFCYL